jgi:hypothetical protein
VIGTPDTPQSVGGFAVAVRLSLPVEGVMAVIFGSVNQVLVRLCACRGQPSLTGCVYARAWASETAANTDRGVYCAEQISFRSEPSGFRNQEPGIR